MRVEQSLPLPIQGISTLADRNRPYGCAASQVNFRSDPVNKLTRRPSSLWKNSLATVSDINQVLYHSYYRAGSDFSFIVDKVNGDVYCFKDDVLINTLNLGSYIGSNLGLYTIEHNTYILNKDVVVKLLDDTDATAIEKVTHINVISALNYSETVKVNVILENGTAFSAQYTVPDLGATPDYDQADKARATKQVAVELATRIALAGGAHNIQTEALGSSVGVWVIGKGQWLQIEVETGQGDRSVKAINKVVESTDGLPLYAVVGTRITIRPDPTTNKGTYYLEANRVADNAPNLYVQLEEVVWVESRNPTEKHSLDVTTLPHMVRFTGNTFELGTIPFKSRAVGDNKSVPIPKFVDNRINSLGYFQKRLVAVTGNTLLMTETDDTLNWFKQSAVRLLVSDTIDVTTSDLSVDEILHILPHNRDLLCIASNAQFKISGTEPITPESVSLQLTTKYECQVSVEPVTIGNSIYFPIDYGDSTGLQEYTGEKDTNQDFAASITNHVIGYLKGKAKLLVASPNLEMIVVTTENSEDNKIYVYEQYTQSDGKRTQRSWSEWVFSETSNIVDAKFRKNELVLIVAENNTLVTKTIPLYTRISTSPIEVYLDDLLELKTLDGLTVTLPNGYDSTDCVVVRGKDTPKELWEAKFTIEGNVITLRDSLPENSNLYIGKRFSSSYEPTRPFRYNEDGSTITTDKIRVSRWIMSLVDTHELLLTKLTDFNNPTIVNFEAKFVGNYKLGEVKTYTGDWKFSYGEEASLARAVFSTDSYLGCTIASISWEGQYYKSKQRM